MTWRRTDDAYHPEPTEEEGQPEPTPPWRAAAPTEPSAPPKELIVEKWDDEIPRPTAADEAREAAARAKAGFAPTAAHVFNLLLFAGACVGAIAGLLVAWMHVVNDPLADAHAYYDAATRLNHHQALYPAGADPNAAEFYRYPPMLAVLLRPFALLPFTLFALLWELFVIGTFVATLRLLGVRRKNTWLAIGLLGVPIGWSITIAQAHIPMTYLLALGQPWSIALAANLKLTPALIAIWWLGRRDYQSFFAFLLYGALIVLAQIVLEPRGSFAFLKTLDDAQLGQVRNLSPYVQSPALWFGLLLLGSLVTLALARTRWGWAAAVTLATISPPRLLVYMLTGLLAAVRAPKVAGVKGPDDEDDAERDDPAAVYRRATR